MDSSSALSARRYHILIFVVGCASLLGCRNNASQRDAYIRDLRMQEDQIYELQDYMTEYQHLLCEQRKENAMLRKQLAMQSEEENRTGVDAEESDDSDRSLLDRMTPRAGEIDDEPQLPEIDPGEPDLPEIDLGEPVPGGDLGEVPEQIPAGELDELSRRVTGQHTQLASATEVFHLPPRPTERANSCAIYAEQMPLEPGSTAEDAMLGLMVIVEPLTTDGSSGYFTGELSLMLVDPLAEDDEWEVSRWDYTPEEVESAWRDNSRRVLDLPLAAPSSTPLGRPLELWVRLLPSDADHKILCSTAVTLADPVGLVGVPVSGGASSTDPAAVVTSGWTAADAFVTKPTKQPDEPASWQTAATKPPPAVARAEATSPPKKKLAGRPPEWSPFR